MSRFVMSAVLLAWLAVSLACCATGKQNIVLRNKEVTDEGSKGELLLAMSGGRWYDPNEMNVSLRKQKFGPASAFSASYTGTPLKITFVDLKNDNGRTIARSVMPVISGDLLIDALRRELTLAGFKIKVVRALPRNVINGIDISSVSTDLEETPRLLSLDGKCTLQTKFDFWRNGIKVSTHDYVTSKSDYAILNQDRLLLNLMTVSTHAIVAESVPTIIKAMSLSNK